MTADGAFSTSSYVTSISPATEEARKSASSPLSGLARKSTSLVPSAIRANLA